MERDELYFLSGLPGSGKTTLGETLRNTGDWLFADIDDALERYVQSRSLPGVLEDLLKLGTLSSEILFKIDSAVRNNNLKQMATSLFENGELTPFIQEHVVQMLIIQAKENILKTRKRIATSGVLIQEVTRRAVVRLSREQGLSPVLVEIKVPIWEILREAKKRQKKRHAGTILSKPPKPKDIKRSLKFVEPPSLVEGWERIITVDRSKVDLKKPEVQQLLLG